MLLDNLLVPHEAVRVLQQAGWVHMVPSIERVTNSDSFVQAQAQAQVGSVPGGSSPRASNTESMAPMDA